MEKHKRTNWILSFDELRILLSAAGSDACEGIYMPQKEFRREDVIRAIHQMAEKGWITLQEEDHFVIEKDLLEVIRIIQNHTASEILRTQDGEYFLYVTEGKTVLSAQNHRKKESLKLTLMDFETFLEWKESAA